MQQNDTDNSPLFDPAEIKTLIQTNRQTWYVVADPHSAKRGVIVENSQLNQLLKKWPLVSVIPNFHPAYLGDITFLKTHHATFPYIVGEMANGIATAKMVINAARSGMIGFFGAAGLVPDIVEKNIVEIKNALTEHTENWGSNLIHSPNEPAIEQAVVECYLRQGVKRVSASAYMELKPSIVQYAFKGLERLPNGTIKRKNHVLAKISRPEVAEHFMRPAPAALLEALVQQGKLTQEEATLARQLPVAQDITVEADSGGHTDNRPAIVLFPLIKALANRINQEYQYDTPIRVGLGGGIGSPEAVVAAFTMGASYVLTGTINQCAAESGLSDQGKQMLLQAQASDVMMTAAADMFELGVKLQVLKRGTLFPNRANELYQLYKNYSSLEEIPIVKREMLEQEIFRQPLDVIWQQTEEYFSRRDPQQVTKAQKDAKYRMALVFRWYLGQSSRWAISGQADRQTDYQIWCGPCIGAFNDWIANSHLADLEHCTVSNIGKNLLFSAVQLMRAAQLRTVGIILPEENIRPAITIEH